MSAVTDVAVAVVLGAGLGVGVCLLVAVAPRWGAMSLAQRVGPYIRDVTDPRGTTVPAAPDLFALWRAAQMRFARAVGGASSLERRLRQADWAMDAAMFRGRQLTWGIVGVGLGGVLMVGLALVGRASASAWILPPVVGLVAVVVCDVVLTRAARARVARLEEELPTLWEFLALCLSAGEGILDSLRRVGDIGAGDMSAEVRGVVLAVGTGSSLPESLARLSERLDVPALSRGVDHLIAAIERGAPLAHVLHAQALDAREDAKRGLLERAARKEIVMLLPLVFLILPLSVIFAVFPGVFMLRLGIG
ncbi:type II secretion system F family protein [Microbacterium sp. NPDC055910]|uniref:type II secretion system F family protein n=1 Tax=Microbacterium sp. NPDC055910 TaxID=3345659 RepID=UPI0035DEFD95